MSIASIVNNLLGLNRDREFEKNIKELAKKDDTDIVGDTLFENHQVDFSAFDGDVFDTSDLSKEDDTFNGLF